MKNNIPIVIIIIAVIIGVVIFLSPEKDVTPVIDNNVFSTTTVSSNNVRMENDIQVIQLSARGGYSPRQSVAKAGIPTIIRFSTDNTFDCSRSVRIPSIKYSGILPQSGNTDVNIGTQSVGLFTGSCGMGMYPFEVDFR